MPWMAAAAVAGANLVGGYFSSQSQADATRDAAGLQKDATLAGIDEQHRQFDAIQKLLQPYVQAGTGALGQQQNLIGLNGNDAQAAAIQALQSSPQFTSMLKQGENSILANASATGGLRGGNTQSALAQFSPTLLAQTINDQYSRLGGITSLGQNAATMTGNAGMQTGNSVAGLLQQMGAAQAGGALAQGKADAQMWALPAQSLALYQGLGGKFNFGGSSNASGGLMDELTSYGVF